MTMIQIFALIGTSAALVAIGYILCFEEND